MYILLMFLCILISLFIFSIMAWLIWYKMSKSCRMIQEIPGPPPLPFIGNTHQLLASSEALLTVCQIEWPAVYGDIYRTTVGFTVGIGVSSPQLLEEILRSQTLIDKGAHYHLLESWLGTGLLLSTGSKWKSRRRLLTPAFHFQILDNFFDVYNEQSRILCQKFCETLSSESVDVYPFMARCALDIICEAAMGIKVEAQLRNSEYVQAVYRICQIIVDRILKPWMLSDFIFSWTSLGKEYRKCLKIIHHFTQQVIENRREENRRSKQLQKHTEMTSFQPKTRQAFLDLLLEASDNGNQLSHEDIREEVDTFMFEGHDTTSAAMSWFLYCMAANPFHQDKVWQELNEVFGDSDRYCTQQDAANLKYLDCCIKEALRMFPSVPGIERQTTKDIQLGPYTIPSGCIVSLLTYAVHHNAEIFPDPDVFRPERFFPECSAGRHPYSYIPFSAGPRNCIGQKFALLEEKVVLSTLLRKFTFELSPLTSRPTPCSEVILKPINGIHLLIKQR